MRLELYLEGTDPYSQGWNAAMRAMATADVRENNHAKWIVEEVHSNWSDYSVLTCSSCRSKFERFHRSKYCPNCGAEMSTERVD